MLLASLPEAERQRLLTELTPEVKAALAFHWPFWARPEQIEPEGDWTFWLILAGRGWGKTRTGAETVRKWVQTDDMVNLIGATVDDARDIMIEGESGILAICPNDERPVYKKSERKLEWPNGAVSLVFTADEPERLRGKQHKRLWADELAAWRYGESWDQAKFGLRLGRQPRAIITTTPKPIKYLKDLLKDKATVVTRGTTYDNRANLAPTFFQEIIKRYEGTRLGRQELNAELLEDIPGALWTRDMILHLPRTSAPHFRRVVVGIDPAVSTSDGANETGLICVGEGMDGKGYVIADRSGVYQPKQWAREASLMAREFQANYAVAEVNQGGDMVEAVIRSEDPQLYVKQVRATRGKYLRAEPVSALYARGNIIHLDTFEALEDQMCSFTPDHDRANNGSPDRLDAMVWAVTDLFPSLVNVSFDEDEPGYTSQGMGRSASTGY